MKEWTSNNKREKDSESHTIEIEIQLVQLVSNLKKFKQKQISTTPSMCWSI